jgi:Zn-dependent protease
MLLTLARIGPVPIRLHWSWLVLSCVVAAALQPAYAGALCGGRAVCGGDVALAVLLAALLGVSVLLHEAGHALVALRLNVPVRSITLFAFGGVLEADADPPGPEGELAIALAGPAVSLLIAAAAALLWWLRGAPLGDDALALLAAHLGLANGLIALFNLLPGYPMDGGRVVRAALWFLSDEELRATEGAAQVGRACGVLLGLLGLAVALAARQLAPAIWGVVVGVFLYRTASGSYRRSLVERALRAVTVGDLMQRRLQMVGPELSLEQFVARFVLGQAETGFAVVGPTASPDADPPLLGMITLRDLRRFTTAQWSAHTVAEAMTPAALLPMLRPAMLAHDALAALNASPDGLLPVREGAQLVGMLRSRDLALFVRMRAART